MSVYPCCPNCHYQRTPADARLHGAICPQCGIVYAKWQSQSESEESPGLEEVTHTITPSKSKRLVALITYTPEEVEDVYFYGRCVVWVLFALWGMSFIINGLDWQDIMNSFMHNINLPFHEFGHVLFSPFGRFMTILGGSLFQLLLPLGLTLVFLIKQKDTFAATITFWWLGQSFVDLAPYIADATFRGLPLIGGLGEESHDWGNLLTMLGWLQYDRAIANFSFTLGSLIMISSMLWGAYLLWQQRKVLTR